MTLEPITHPLLERAGVRHGFFTRADGVAREPTPGDPRRARIAAWFGGQVGNMAICNQVHSAVARIAERGWENEHPDGDGVATTAPKVVCAVLTADCAPVLLSDPEAGVVAAAHAGWKGALSGIIHSTVTAMQAAGADPRRTVAVVGPCIAQASYEVDEDFEARFEHHDPGSSRFFLPGTTRDKRLFDLPAFVLWRLEQAGIGESAWTGHDTCADERFLSWRRDTLRGLIQGDRMVSAISLGDWGDG